MKKFFIVDGSSCFYRAFHALPVFTNSSGLPTNAVYGFTQTLRKLINDYSPDYMLVAFDSRGPTHRHTLYENYKAQRPSMPDELASQIPYIKEMVKAFNIASLEKDGFEADDIIAMAARKGSADGLKVYIISGDKDLYQLVNDNVFILDYVKDRELGEAEVREKFGVGPGRIADLLALAGDTSDNVFPIMPGARLKSTKKKVGIMECYEDREKKGYAWNSFMNQRWEHHDGTERKVKDQFAKNEILVDLTKQPDSILIRMAETMNTAMQAEGKRTVGIAFLRFAHKYELTTIEQSPEQYVKYFNARY